MNRTQIALLVIGCSALAFFLLFPIWSQSNGATKIDLGRSWILNPPEGVEPEDFGDPSADNALGAEDRRRMREHAAAGFGEPEIHWVLQGYGIVVVLIVTITGVIAARDRRPRSRAA